MIFGIFGLFRKNIWREVFAWVGFLSRLARVKYDAYLYKANGSLGDMDDFVVHINELPAKLQQHNKLDTNDINNTKF